MLAEEYILTVPFATQLQSGLTEQISAAYRNFNFSNSIGLLFQADGSQNTSIEESPDVVRKQVTPNNAKAFPIYNFHHWTF
jgi:hypothetical protein